MYESSTVITFSRKFGWSLRQPKSSWHIFTCLSFCSSVKNTFGKNYANNFLVPKLSVTISLTIVCCQFKCSDIIRTLNIQSEFKRFFAFTKFSWFLIVEERLGCLSSSICYVPSRNKVTRISTNYNPIFCLSLVCEAFAWHWCRNVPIEMIREGKPVFRWTSTCVLINYIS